MTLDLLEVVARKVVEGHRFGPLNLALRPFARAATHHSSMDGKSHLLLVQDLLAAVAGEDLGEPLEVQPGLAQLLGLPAPVPYVKKLEGRSVAPEDGAGVEVFKVRVQRLQLTVEETETLMQRARKEGTTVHAALVAALTLAGKRYSDAWNLGPVRCMSPMDMRRTLGLPDAAGLLVSLHHGAVPAPDGASFWHIARTVRKDMLPAKSADGARHLLSAMASSVAEEHNARDLYDSSVLNGHLLHELMVTNSAGYRVRLLASLSGLLSVVSGCRRFRLAAAFMLIAAHVQGSRLSRSQHCATECCHASANSR